MKRYLLSASLMVICLAPLYAARAEIPPVPAAESTDEAKAHAARQLISRIAKKFADADRDRKMKEDPVGAQLAGFSENEELLFQLKIKTGDLVESPVLVRVKGGQMLVSLRDFMVSTLLPVQVNMQTGTAFGTIDREQPFSLNTQTRQVNSARGSFNFSKDVQVTENDIFVPYEELASWLGLKIEPNVTALEMEIVSGFQLPIEKRMAYAGRNQRVKRPDPVLPRLKDEAPARAYPLVDVSTSVSHKIEGDVPLDDTQKGLQGTAFIRTAGDIAGGTLVTQTSLEKNEKLTAFRATFSEQSLEADLLGPLKARQYELGDVYSPTLQLRTGSYNGVGARVSNISPNRRGFSPTTAIRGNAFPNWDVELYRNEQLVDIQTVGDDGVYSFENIDLYSSNNNFKVVLYGPQGEREEEDVYIPVDTKRISSEESSYDIAVMSQDRQLYRKGDNNSKSSGDAAVVATFETPLNEMTSANMGFEMGSKVGESIMAGHAGVSTVMGGTLLNLDGAVDENGEVASQLVARREFGDYRVRNELRANSERYGVVDDLVGRPTVFSNKLGVTGPLPIDLGNRASFNIEMGHGLNGDGELQQDYRAGINTSLYRRFNLGQQFSYGTSETEGVEDTILSTTTLSGAYGKNRLRLTSNYEIAPDSELQSLQARYTRPIAEDLDFNMDVRHTPDPELTEGTAQLNWRAGWADISPSVSYNSEKEVTAMLNTRFGLMRDPLSKDIKSFQDGITSNGGISVFVYLDNNGDNIYNEGDTPVPDVTIKAPQNGGEVITDETGHALFSLLINMRPTDIYVQEETLSDPYWISAYEGFSVVPREGHVVTVEFPIHTGGEIDGNVLLRTADNQTQNLRGIELSLYDLKGKKVKSTFSESDGFYLIDRVPPGRYYLTVDNKSFDGKYARPKPQPVLIKTNGSLMSGNNIYLREDGTDVAVSFYDDAADLKIDPSTLHGRSLFLNLGSYKSQLTLGLAWFKIRSMFKRELKDMEILEMPSESLPNQKDNNYTLRVLALSDDMGDAYNKCKVLQANGQTCSVEVIPEQAPARVATQ